MFEELGGYTAEGFAVGYEKKISEVNSMIRDSIQPPAMNEAKIGAGEDMYDMFTEYLPYLKTIAEKRNVYVCHLRREFENDITRVANNGATRRKTIKSAARGY